MRNRPAMAFVLTVMASVVISLAVGVLFVLPLLLVPPLSYDNSPFPLISPVRAGERLIITFERTVPGDKPVVTHFTIFLVNANTRERVFMAAGDLSNPPGHVKETISFLAVPLETMPGRYYFENTSVASGLLRDFYIPSRTQVFEVIR